MGEPAGVGGELTLHAWRLDNDRKQRANDTDAIPPFFVVDDPDRLAALAQHLSLDIPICKIANPNEAALAWPSALPILAQDLTVASTPGVPTAENASAVIRSIEVAAKLALDGSVSGLVTNPIQKQTLYEAGFGFAGHTDFLGALADEDSSQTFDPVMMLATEGLRVVPVTVHVSLSEAIASLTTERITRTAITVIDALRREFGISEPCIAVLGLNPHAGEGGALGTEDRDIIVPAIRDLENRGMKVIGPLAADTAFRSDFRDGVDAYLCMYHDQALIPIKTLDFWNTVNITLGLPFVRTSPGHGTGLDIAGKGSANPASFVAALRQAAALAEIKAT
jgi:4-hydroxythreonine-4-phosphate dehydrogenase